MKSITVIFLTLFLLSLGNLSFAQSPDTLNANKATVIFYRNSMWGAAYSFKLFMDNSYLSKIKYKCFFVYNIAEGEHTFWGKVNAKNEIELNVKAGHIYFIECKVGGAGDNIHPKFILQTDNEIAAKSKKHFLKKRLEENHIKL